MKLYRIADRRYEPAGGEGARIYGARWNSPGRAVIYTSVTYSGAMLEMLVHTGRKIPRHHVCVTFEVPEDLPVYRLDPDAVAGWRTPDMIASRTAGDHWLEMRTTAVMLVPSVVFADERNALINPLHPDAARIRTLGIEPVRWDTRLFGNITVP